jgi:hypothetical protein
VVVGTVPLRLLALRLPALLVGLPLLDCNDLYRLR